MKTSLLISILMLASYMSNAQNLDIARAGLVKAYATLSPAYDISHRESSFYAHGCLEAYLENTISWSGEIYLGLGPLNKSNSSHATYHTLFSGINLHHIRSNHDLYLGIQPGIALSKSFSTTHDLQSSSSLVPVASAVVGYNYFVHRFFHFFVQGRWVLGQYNDAEYKTLNELRLSAGLGFNFNTKK